MRVRAVPTIGILLLWGMLCGSHSFAQPAPSDHQTAAMTAIDAQRWDEALQELELAYRESPSPTLIYWRIIVLEQVDHPKLALELLREHRDDFSDLPEARELGALEERLRAAISNGSAEPSETELVSDNGGSERDDIETTETLPEPRRRPIVGPAILGVLGAGSLAVGIYGFATSRCSRESADGTCLEGIRTSTTPSIIYTTVGAGALVGALIWWAVGGTNQSAGLSVSPAGFRYVF